MSALWTNGGGHNGGADEDVSGGVIMDGADEMDGDGAEEVGAPEALHDGDGRGVGDLQVAHDAAGHGACRLLGRVEAVDERSHFFVVGVWW